MPTFCADTPTQACPAAASERWKNPQSGAASMPAETLCHSTMTVPLKRSGFEGFRTTMRVRKEASAPGVTSHRPSAPRSPCQLVRAGRPFEAELGLLVPERRQVVVPHDVGRVARHFPKRCFSCAGHGHPPWGRRPSGAATVRIRRDQRLRAARSRATHHTCSPCASPSGPRPLIRPLAPTSTRRPSTCAPGPKIAVRWRPSSASITASMTAISRHPCRWRPPLRRGRARCPSPWPHCSSRCTSPSSWPRTSPWST